MKYKMIRDEQEPVGVDRRRCFRFRSDSKATLEFYVKIPRQFTIIDFSPEGVSFFSDAPLVVGQTIELSLEARETFSLNILECQAENEFVSQESARFRIRCRFDTPLNDAQWQALKVQVQSDKGPITLISK